MELMKIFSEVTLASKCGPLTIEKHAMKTRSTEKLL